MDRIASFSFVNKTRFTEDWLKLFPDFTAEKVSEIYEGLKLPCRATQGSAGYDFYAPLAFLLNEGESITIPTGIRAQIDEGWVLSIYPRSGLGFKYRVQLSNTVGIVDSDYYYSDNEGHIFIKIINANRENKPVRIGSGEAFAQGVFLPFGITREDKATSVRNGGFGSTDKK